MEHIIYDNKNKNKTQKTNSGMHQLHKFYIPKEEMRQIQNSPQNIRFHLRVLCGLGYTHHDTLTLLACDTIFFRNKTC